jgi:AraC-like DNA-binding protein
VPVSAVFDTGQIPKADRAEAVRAAVAEHLVPVEIDFAADRGPAAHIAITDLAELTVWTSTSNAVKVHRTAAQTHDDFTPSIFMGLQMTGSCVVVQHGREAILRRGDLVIYDSTSPWVISDVDGIRQHKFRIPLDRLALPADVIRRVCAVSLSPGHPIADLAATYFHRLALRPGVFDRPGGDVVSQPSIELLRAVITTHLDAAELGKESLHATLVVRIMEYVRTHLREPDLSAGRIAAEHHISVRQLYRILAAEGISLGDWIRARRLEECRKDLASAGYGDPIFAVARRWGFTDASSFTRMFRATFGMSPREWREINRRPPH